MKVAFIGDANVGKTTYIHKLFGDTEPVKSTIGASVIPYEINGVRYNLWDISGDVNTRNFYSGYLMNTDIAIVMYDVMNEKSYQNVRFYIDEILKYSPKCKIIICGTKNDMELKVVSTKMLHEDYKKMYSCAEISTANDKNLTCLFVES